MAATGAVQGWEVHLRNSIIADNTSWRTSQGLIDDDCAGTMVSGGYNLIEAKPPSCGFMGDGNLYGVDPQLLGLADNGGPTRTKALRATQSDRSPAIDAGNPVACADQMGTPYVADQRGYSRPANGRCDIGAYEHDGVPSSPVPTPTPSPTPISHTVFIPVVVR